MPPHAANTVDAAALADELARYRVVDPHRLGELLAEFSCDGAQTLADYLVRCGVLTAFQAGRALAGETAMLVLGQYRLTGVAGRGTFGPLFAATHAAKPGAFAVRVTPLRSLWQARQAKQFARALAAGVGHPGVVPLVEVDSANGFHYLVWPQADGVRLSDGGPLPPGDVVALLGHLANALTACHAGGAAHGALTPCCVSVTPDGLPRLLELGAGALLAQNLDADESLFDSMSMAFASAGVLAYAAPELVLSPLKPTPASDQYALGAVGYFALTGLPPYPHPALADQLRAKQGGPPSAAVVNPDVPPELAAVLDRMMAPNPADRFATLLEVEARLAELTVAGPSPVEPSEVESLLLSRLAGLRAQKSGAISWTATGSGALRPAARDDSDASGTVSTCPKRPKPFPTPSRIAPRPLPSVRGNRSWRSDCSGHSTATTRTARPRRPTRTCPRRCRRSGTRSTRTHRHRTNPPPRPRRGQARPPKNSFVLKKVRRSLLFWQAPRDPVQVSVFGPAAATPGQTVRLTIYLHTPDADANVRTLSRAFQHDAELIGTGYLSREVPRGAEPAVHVSVANAGVGKAPLKCVWRGQPHRLGFDLHVPWESAGGWSPGLVSVGLNDVRVGRVEFWLNVLPRKA